MSNSAKKRKRRTIFYWTCLIIFTAALFVAVFMFLGIVGQFANAYEASMPDYAVDEYMNGLNETGWNNSMNIAASGMTNDFQSPEACVEIVKGTLQGDFTKVKAAGGNDNTTNYSIQNNGKTIGTFSITRDLDAKTEFSMLEKYVDLHPWKLSGDAYDFSYLLKSVEETVPATYTVKLNGTEIGEEYITEKDIHYDVLDDYYEEYPNLPTKVTYKVENLVGDVSVEILDDSGEPYEIDWTQDDSQFMTPCSQAELAELQIFADEFVEAYQYFFGTKNIDWTYPNLLQYVKQDSKMFELMRAQVDSGTAYIHYDNIVFNSKVFNGAFSLGGGFYVIDETVESTTTGASTYKTVHETTELKVIVVKEGDQILAVNVA